MHPQISRRLLKEQPYLNLELYGRRGPACYVEIGDVVYAQAALPPHPERWLTPAPRVRVTAYDGQTAALARPLTGRARLAWEAEARQARQLLRRKYSWFQRRWAAVRAWLAGNRLAWVALHLTKD